MVFDVIIDLDVLFLHEYKNTEITNRYNIWIQPKIKQKVDL